MEIELHTSFSESQTSTIVRAVSKYVNYYHIVLKLGIYEDKITSPQKYGGSVLETVAFGEPGKIFVNKRLKTGLAQLENVIKHEMSHAIKPVRQAPLMQFMAVMSDGYLLVGYYGLSLIMINPANGKEIRFTYIEEAAAEFCAIRIEEGYSIRNSREYFYLGSLMIEMSKEGWINEFELVRMIQNNDVTGFCSQILKTPAKSLTTQEIEFVADAFQTARDGKDKREIIDSIKERRKR